MPDKDTVCLEIATATGIPPLLVSRYIIPYVWLSMQCRDLYCQYIGERLQLAKHMKEAEMHPGLFLARRVKLTRFYIQLSKLEGTTRDKYREIDYFFKGREALVFMDQRSSLTCVIYETEENNILPEEYRTEAHKPTPLSSLIV